ncbi:uncharacterized protein CIMG_10567 [Coccidioides immitis RS]|uniref:Uncharacterized protein n=6 Tax=Coccidioides TaxID=5500 RepID=A0A0D8JSN9_COCIM|nr:uncharacterized protein CIMG_10567 [Coccidioides immitis RS]EFW13620.1 conserved hypothetical protein [Coccidioides posadasii str. Silveira]KMM66016.1 hypothetical protein CPAG_02357 [Coccidioides posadasii RMSCC 3488]KMP00400.1 hypothetical protein CIRG_00542 [Coccidioides immitis RMSCC 2394]KMU76789.1 hypothetical protein CISG_05622 [Coccidioides immitis RMSCC 3703]KMU84592.1 hypothetical protein CIHG_02376 [Coccidioides immitis H538.4]TPX26531.1 hypothetical protein DIZ76_011993 [Coccid
MKYTTLLAAVALVPAALAAAVDGAAPAPLAERACVPSKCRCIGGQGQFCGNEAINHHCKNGHVYECNRHTGKTCDYGYRKSCGQCGKLSC